MRSKWIGSWTVALACTMGSVEGAQPGPNQSLPLPDLSKGTLLRVAYVENPRFAPLSEAQITAILAQSASTMKQHFGVEVRFNPPTRLPIAPLFAAISARRRAAAESARLDPTNDAPTQERLARTLLDDVRVDGDINALQKFAAPHLLMPPKDNTPLAFARAVIATQHSLLRAWHDTSAADGKPLLGTDRYNEYNFWLALGDTDLPYEIIITNQLIASAELSGNSVHSALRGGVSNGITSQNRKGRYSLVSVVSSYPFLDKSKHALKLRGGDQPGTDDGNRYMGLMLAHELGHQLLHLGHPFGNSNCLMTPPIQLEFRAWSQALSPSHCLLASNPANTPGVIKFALPETLFK
jgi:hypothetical protein